MFAKRLEDGIFRWPTIEDGVMRLSAAQLSALLEGLGWRLVHEARETPAPTQAGYCWQRCGEVNQERRTHAGRA
ncbi:IS66 family insertion sequence element accessory protein TnpB [Bradyrhizobium sp. 41S5]|nr:IS66 family insertion sequence element accessory protein TnpB [Bradyrhizobium sp. 41S5]